VPALLLKFLDLFAGEVKYRSPEFVRCCDLVRLRPSSDSVDQSERGAIRIRQLFRPLDNADALGREIDCA
jgi:hypothetical protein